MPSNYVESSWTQSDQPFETPLRPNTLSEFVGQDTVRQRLEILLLAAQERQEPMRHCLFSGPPGLGKTTLANLIARTTGAELTVTSGPAIEKAGDLAGFLTNLKRGDILFIDEIHRLAKTAEEYLYSAMEDFFLDITLDTGANARSVRVSLQPFTLIGATTRCGLLSAPMRSRFGVHLRLDHYDDVSLQNIILRSAALLKANLETDAAMKIAQRSRGTPRIANNLLRWVRDYAHAHRHSVISSSIASAALTLLAIDDAGLEEMDKKILNVIIGHYEGGPVGVQAIAAAVGEEPHTIEEVYEPYLVLRGFVRRTSRGREATPLAYQHLGYKKDL